MDEIIRRAIGKREAKITKCKSCCEFASDGKLGEGPKPSLRAAPAQWNYSTAASHGTKLVRDNFKLILTFI